MVLLCGTLGLVAAGSHAGETEARTDLAPEDRQRVDAVIKLTSDFMKPEPFEAMSAGAATVATTWSREAFSLPFATMPANQRQDFWLGRALFQKLWVSAPSSTLASDGLGPLYNARSCQSCHVNDGRGRPPRDGEDALSMILRLARPARTEEEHARLKDRHALNFPDDTYGAQLQNLAVPGLKAEGKPRVTYSERQITLTGGGTISLRQPAYSIDDLSDGPLGLDTTLSARIAQPTLGLTLIEAIALADILATADPSDRDGDGISGKPAWVRDRRTGALALGRFGWKAQNATVRDQAAMAFSHDLGLSTPEAPDAYGDCTSRQTTCCSMPNGVQTRLSDTEAPTPVVDLVTFYAGHLGVPERRDVGSPGVLRGKQMFYESGCASCHRSKYVTRRDPSDPLHSFQLIWPYSDFLLHDMGTDLADGQEVGDANGREWRTPPLWGIGLTGAVNGNAFYLHDGRARNLAEAILWHGGEARKARNAFAELQPPDRQALITFLESL